MAVEIIEHIFDPWQAIAQHQKAANLYQQFGATATFVGTMRDFNDNTDVSSMTLEHYPAMTAHYLDKLIEEAKTKWPLLDVLIIHRVGDITPS